MRFLGPRRALASIEPALFENSNREHLAQARLWDFFDRASLSIPLWPSVRP